jgi:ATP-dependent protease ClpP protease subunit
MTSTENDGFAPPPKHESEHAAEATPAAELTPVPRIPSRTPLYEAMNASRYFRQSIIREIEQITKTTLICYVSPHLEIRREDVVGMVDLLHNVTSGTAIDLLLHSPGGNIDAAEKLITLVRKRAGSAPVRVVVPDYAKSAGTLMALGADTLVMSDSSELGVIDPQIEVPSANGHLQNLSAQSYLDAFELHSKNLKAHPDDPVAQLMLSKMEPAMVRKLERMTERSRSIAVALLGSGMIKDEDDAKRIAGELSDTKKWHSHGQMIAHETARGLGLNVSYLPPHDQLWILYWRLFCLQLTAANGNIKLFEGAYASLPIA